MDGDGPCNQSEPITSAYTVRNNHLNLVTSDLETLGESGTGSFSSLAGSVRRGFRSAEMDLEVWYCLYDRNAHIEIKNRNVDR